jgi:acyl-CoA thioesterase-1
VSAPEVDRRVLVFGDSIVAGVGDPEGRGWVGRVVAASWAAGLPLTAYPLGVRRQTSVEVARRWRDETRPRLAAGADCRLVFAVGVNDTTIEDGAERVAPDASEATLAGMLDDAHAQGLRAFVVGPSPVCDAQQTARIAGLSGRLRTVCAARGVPYCDVVEPLSSSAAWLAEAAAGDGAHPAAGGYEALARLVLAGGWLEWLASSARRRGSGAVAWRQP